MSKRTYLDLVKHVEETLTVALGPGGFPYSSELAAVALKAADDSLTAETEIATLEHRLFGAQAGAAISQHQNQLLADEVARLKGRLAYADHYIKEQVAVANAEIAALEADYERRIHEAEDAGGVPRRHEVKWTSFEEMRLVKLYRSGKTEAQIARAVQRYGDAVCVRLSKIEFGKAMQRIRGEKEHHWYDRLREHYFRSDVSILLHHRDVTSPNQFAEHIIEAFDAVPQATRAA